MKTKRPFSRLVQNSRGMISADFIFAITLSVGLCIALFSLTFTLSMIEVAQYIAFSTARAHAAGHVNPQAQEGLARKKFSEFLNNRYLGTLINNPEGGWFKIDTLEVRGGGASGATFADSYPNRDDRVPQVGVRFKFYPRILGVKIPFLGAASDEASSGGISTKVTGLLIREPTQSECQEQMKRRYEAILALDPPRFGALGSSGNSDWAPMEDNGC